MGRCQYNWTAAGASGEKSSRPGVVHSSVGALVGVNEPLSRVHDHERAEGVNALLRCSRRNATVRAPPR